MHQLIATLFALLISLCHHTSFTAPQGEAAEVPGSVQTLSAAEGDSVMLPDRYQLARYTSESGYSGSACSSCGRMERISSER